MILEIKKPEDLPVDNLSALLLDSIRGGASIGFLDSSTHSDISAYWRDIQRKLDQNLHLWIATVDGRVAGTVQLALCPKDNGRHRAEVQKLLVHRDYRGQGLASELMRIAESFAVEDGRSLLVLDTRSGSLAETLYKKWGWTEFGRLQDYAADPDGTPGECTFLYKKLK